MNSRKKVVEGVCLSENRVSHIFIAENMTKHVMDSYNPFTFVQLRPKLGGKLNFDLILALDLLTGRNKLYSKRVIGTHHQTSG